jgi:carboxymethylenebutenolidase
MPTAELTLKTPDGPMPAYEATPDEVTRGGLVVIQEAFGVTAHIEDVCRRAAGAGWRSVAPALFHRLGSPVFRYDDFEAMRPAMGQLKAEGIRTDLDAAFAHLASVGLGGRRSAIVGFCMGGSVAFHAGVERELGAAVTFYGGGIEGGRFGFPDQINEAPSLRSPWLGLYGDDDQSIPVAQVERLREAAAGAPVPTEVVRYAGAGHGFHCDDRPDNFDATAAKDGWKRALAWLDRHVAAGEA